jgi:hypothetical protein
MNARNKEQENLREESSKAENVSNDALEDDGTPVMDEMDLQENNLSEEEADQVEWDAPQSGGSGRTGSDE